MKKLSILTLSILIFGVTSLIYSNDIVTVYTSPSPPLAFESDNGELIGYSVDIVNELMERVGNQSEIKVAPWARGYDHFLNDPNTAIFTASRNAARENIANWIIQLTTRRSVLYGKTGTSLNISSLEEAKRYKIGIMRNGNRQKYLEERGFTNMEPSTTEAQNLQKLLAGRVDLVFLSSLEAASNLQQIGHTYDDIVPIYTVFENDSWLMISQSGTPMRTVRKWQQAAEAMKTDGTYNQIAQKWVRYIKETYGVDTEVQDNVLMFFTE